MNAHLPTLHARCLRVLSVALYQGAGAVVCLLALVLVAAPSHAGVLTRDELARRVPAPLTVGERDAELPVWPLFSQQATGGALAGYVFESADLAPTPGFSGVPVNLLVAIDPAGKFIGVEVLSQHEPVFQYGLGEAPLLEYVRQYQGVSLRQSITIETGARSARNPDAARAYLDGISKATVSVRIINESLLGAALQVARKKLGFGAGSDASRIARVRPELREAMTLRQLLDSGLVRHLRVTNGDIEKLYAHSDGARLDQDALDRPQDAFIDLYLALVSVPSVAHSLLTEESRRKLQPWIAAGESAVLVMSAGRHRVPGAEFVRGGIPDRLLLRQHQLPIDMRDLDLDLKLQPGSALPPDADLTIFRINSEAGLDPGAALDFTLPVVRSKGQFYPERITRELALDYRVPPRFLIAAPVKPAAWYAAWRERRIDLLVLAAGLAVLAVALSLPRRLSANGRRFAWFRRVYLLFTVGFIGYYAQAQLSIVNLTGAAQALVAGRSPGFLLFDPMTVVLWAFVLVSLLVWGRGTFCGWLCPFGALQEMTGKLARLVRLPQVRFSAVVDARLKRLKYLLLALVIGTAVLGGFLIAHVETCRVAACCCDGVPGFNRAGWTAQQVNAAVDTMVELEPFKTAITLNFVRHWPYVLYAVALLAVSAFVNKFFCRYLCPLGATLAVLGRFRLWNWLPRRAECGAPCQACRHRCDYQAIKPDGAVVYAECFQCMDCVVIHESDDKCAPRLLARKRARSIPIHPAPGVQS